MSADALKSILYVEDDADIRSIALLALVDVGGFEVQACASGAEALEAIKSSKPQLVLLDVMMPGMDGPQTLVKLRETQNGASVPVIFVTAKVQPDEVKRYREMGAIEVIHKPFDPMTLAAQLDKIWSDQK